MGGAHVDSYSSLALSLNHLIDPSGEARRGRAVISAKFGLQDDWLDLWRRVSSWRREGLGVQQPD